MMFKIVKVKEQTFLIDAADIIDALATSNTEPPKQESTIDLHITLQKEVKA